MTTLAQFLAAERTAIIDHFVERVRDTVAPPALSRGQLVDHLPDFFAEVVAALEDRSGPRGHRAAVRATSQEHGRQRVAIGYDPIRSRASSSLTFRSLGHASAGSFSIC